MEERRAALKASKLTKRYNMVESVQSSEQNDNPNLQEASYVLLMLSGLRVDTAKMAEAFIKLEGEEEVSPYPTL